MANEYTVSNDNAAGLVIPVKVRKAATDVSSVNKADFMGGVGPGTAPMTAPRTGNGTTSGPATVVNGVYTQPTAGGTN